MKRIGGLIEEIASAENVSAALDAVLRGTRRKASAQGRRLMARREAVVAELCSELRGGTFRLGGYRERVIREWGKERRLQIVSMRDRAAVWAVMNVVDARLRGRYIRDTGASVKGRGTHDLLARVVKALKDDPQGTRYCYKADIRRFYENIRQDTVMECYRKVIKDKTVLTLLEHFTTMLPTGLSFGLRSSQSGGNLLLSYALDHWLKDRLGVRHYFRYCDDIVVLGADKRELWRIRDVCHERTAAIGLTIKPDERVFPVAEGIDFLGYVIRPGYVRLRKRTKLRAAARLRKIKSRRRRGEVLASLYGQCKHGDCNHLFHKLTHRTMKSFSELGLTWRPKDGKRRLPGRMVSVRDLANVEITVIDYEDGISTRHGEDKAVVGCELDGEPVKFFTGSEELRDILAQAREAGAFPFTTTLKSVSFGQGKQKYIFT